MTEPIKFNFSNANYFDFGNSAESLNMFTASKKNWTSKCFPWLRC